jgi:hypothetical protein
LGRRHRQGRELPERYVDQLVQTFSELTSITPDSVDAQRCCAVEDRPEDGDSGGFLERLIDFAETRVYQQHLCHFDHLFAGLGIGGEVFKRLRVSVSGMTARPFTLLHGDLHRDNLIVDDEGELWVIDWELAMFGDPLYDLATHLYLMRYPQDQARRLVYRWVEVVEAMRSGSAAGFEDDLPRIVDFKAAQSVFTDVIRLASDMPDLQSVMEAARRLHDVIVRGVEPLGLASVPSRRSIVSSLLDWRSRQAEQYVSSPA